MININFQTSYPLSEGILKYKYNHERLEKKLSKIEKIFTENKEKIFETMFELTQMNFKYEELDIWAIEGKYPSISNPPLLNISKKEKIVLFDLVCILTHKLFHENNFYDFFESSMGINESKLEGMVYLISIKILEKLFSKKELDKIKIELKSDMFNLFIWDECDDFEKRIDFSIPLLKHPRNIFY